MKKNVAFNHFADTCYIRQTGVNSEGREGVPGEVVEVEVGDPEEARRLARVNLAQARLCNNEEVNRCNGRRKKGVVFLVHTTK